MMILLLTTVSQKKQKADKTYLGKLQFREVIGERVTVDSYAFCLSFVNSRRPMLILFDFVFSLQSREVF